MRNDILAKIIFATIVGIFMIIILCIPLAIFAYSAYTCNFWLYGITLVILFILWIFLELNEQ